MATGHPHFHPCPWLPLPWFHITWSFFLSPPSCKGVDWKTIHYFFLSLRRPTREEGPYQRGGEWGIEIKFRAVILNWHLEIFCRPAGKGKVAVVAPNWGKVRRTRPFLVIIVGSAVSPQPYQSELQTARSLCYCWFLYLFFWCVSIIKYCYCFFDIGLCSLYSVKAWVPQLHPGELEKQQQNQQRDLLPPPL
jgi:hypothetical protein